MNKKHLIIISIIITFCISAPISQSRAYDLVLNGAEIGGGSIRIHSSKLQLKVFELLGLSKDEVDNKFGFWNKPEENRNRFLSNLYKGLFELLLRFENDWSNGTVAIKCPKSQNETAKTLLWSSLSEMEEDHLKTIAAVPYRDPRGNSTSNEIIERRSQEQKKSNYSSTNSWKKRWIRTKY